MTTPSAAETAALDEAPLRKLYRSADGRVLGGVARGLAGHLRLPVSWVRLAFVVMMMANGLGVPLYGLFWFVVPLGAPAAGPRAPATPGLRHLLRRPDKRQVLALAVLAAALATLGANVHFPVDARYLWPLLVVGIGAAVVWRQADDSRRAYWAAATRRSRWLPLLRTAAGTVLVCLGVAGFVVGQSPPAEALALVLQASVAVVVGIALLAGPYVIRMVRELSEERTMRIRAQERAEVAAHIHDSVLHTLTLIQRNSENGREVARLARAQERELRVWLYKSAERVREPAEEEEKPGTLAEAVRATAAEVEDHHGVPIEVVCVGDCTLDERLAAQLQSAREAMVNAAKYGGEGGPVRVFAEVEGRTVFVSVRDRGPGFDLDSVPADRMGVRESIVGRMQRNGGTARVRSTPGEGTEVELTMERADD
ncbi:ATP-binding protein [Streptomyces hoynatensis]|uniref:ATP-binding protein n=1 Tax=Streptomyces hoynatensis TaxID=1141874 RepID=A0A3A9ZEQ6_9ACTN|nr:ATP-binding protein [Streptomyces hoynatensis]RKN46828.1 ATP-binding protein [Streptomyces hoynatensis]